MKSMPSPDGNRNSRDFFPPDPSPLTASSVVERSVLDTATVAWAGHAPGMLLSVESQGGEECPVVADLPNWSFYNKMELSRKA